MVMAMFRGGKAIFFSYQNVKIHFSYIYARLSFIEDMVFQSGSGFRVPKSLGASRWPMGCSGCPTAVALTKSYSTNSPATIHAVMRIFGSEERAESRRMIPHSQPHDESEVTEGDCSSSSSRHYDEETPLLRTNDDDQYTVEEAGNWPSHPSTTASSSSPSSSSSSSFRSVVALSLLFTISLLAVGITEYSPANPSSAITNTRTNMAEAKPTAHVLTAHTLSKINLDAHDNTGQNHPTRKSASKTTGAQHWDGFHNICKLSTKVQTCEHPTTTFIVDADKDGKWPQGFSWTILKDSITDERRDRSGREVEFHSKSFLHTEKGIFDSPLLKGKEVKCRHFVTDLCLTGNYIVYANSGASCNNYHASVHFTVDHHCIIFIHSIFII